MIFASKTMIFGCALAMIIGASLVSPILILNTVIDPFPENPQVIVNPQSPNSQIAVNLKNVYVELGTITTNIRPNSTETVTQPAFSGAIVVSATKYLNDNQNIPDAESDFFVMQIFTENGTSIRNQTVFIGTAYTRSFTGCIDSTQMGKAIPSMRMSGGGTFFNTWSIGTTHVNSGAFRGNIRSTTAAILEDAQTLTITLSRVGSIVVRGNSTVVSTSDAGLIETVQLVRQGDGFLYNKDGSSTPISLPNFNRPHP